MRRENVGKIFRHRGYPMRSHSETRWASMMDFIGIRWHYEPRLFDTSLGMYLPDFYLPDMGTYLEVKGPEPTKDEIKKADDVQAQTGCPVIFGHGRPEMKGLHLGGGKLSAWICGKEIHVSLFEISRGIEKRRGLRDCALFAYAGRIQQKNPCASYKEILEEYLRSHLTRSQEENDRAEENKQLNSDVGPMVGPTTDMQHIFFGVVCWLKSKIIETQGE